MTLQRLNSRFGVVSQLRFVEDASGLIIAEIENTKASARVCLQGAHLLSWQPRCASVPVVWWSTAARLAQGKCPHSGAPVCWPWFGAHAKDSSLPAHGFVRTSPWQVVESGAEADGATRLTLQLMDNPQWRAHWPQGGELKLTMMIGDTLKMQLATSNTGEQAFIISEALHTYLQISDIAKVKVTGLANTQYLDKVEQFARKHQVGDLTFSGETDRVYVNTETACTIEDPGLQRRILISKSGSQSTVVWTPWADKAAQMGDLGANEGWRTMLCVESANAADNPVSVAPGETHVLGVEYSTSAL